MARIARIVIPHYPHHVTQRGSRRQTTFFSDQDYQTYLDYLVNYKELYGVAIWAYCLMPNHVHLIAVPQTKEALSKCISRAHRLYALHINSRNRWQGHLWQERFYSVVMSDQHLLLGARYVEMNPVRAGLCANPEDWKWSSARAHLHNQPDKIVDVEPLLNRISDWKAFLSSEINQDELTDFRKRTRTGRPAGNDQFIGKLESITGVRIRKQKPGPKTGRN